MGGNGTHIGSTANVYIVTVSERLARKEGNPDLAITPYKWAKIGLPVMILTLVICTIIMYLFFDFYSTPFPRIGVKKRLLFAIDAGALKKQWYAL